VTGVLNTSYHMQYSWHVPNNLPRKWQDSWNKFSVKLALAGRGSSMSATNN